MSCVKMVKASITKPSLYKILHYVQFTSTVEYNSNDDDRNMIIMNISAKYSSHCL